MAKHQPGPGVTILLTKADRNKLASFRSASKKHVALVTKTAAAARQELIDAGIYTRSGKLKKQYRSVA